MSVRVILCANDRVGVAVARYLLARGDEIVRLYLHEPEYRKQGDALQAVCAGVETCDAGLLKDAGHVEGLAELGADFLITVYWRYLLSEQVIGAVGQTVNFHPALLPINRGWYPHVHSLIDGSPTGVTLHAIDKHADTGPIWAQREVPIEPTDTAYEIYHRQQGAIVELFQATWPDISTGQLTAKAQDESLAVYHRKSELDAFDALDPDAMMRVGDLLNLLRARSFGDLGFAHYTDQGRQVHVNLRLSYSHRFDPPDHG